MLLSVSEVICNYTLLYLSLNNARIPYIYKDWDFHISTLFKWCVMLKNCFDGIGFFCPKKLSKILSCTKFLFHSNSSYVITVNGVRGTTCTHWFYFMLFWCLQNSYKKKTTQYDRLGTLMYHENVKVLLGEC